METQVYEELDVLVAAIFELFDKMLTFEQTRTQLNKLISDYEFIFGYNNFTENLKQVITDTLASNKGWGFLFLKNKVKKYIYEY